MALRSADSSTTVTSSARSRRRRRMYASLRCSRRIFSTLRSARASPMSCLSCLDRALVDMFVLRSGRMVHDDLILARPLGPGPLVLRRPPTPWSLAAHKAGAKGAGTQGTPSAAPWSGSARAASRQALRHHASSTASGTTGVQQLLKTVAADAPPTSAWGASAAGAIAPDPARGSGEQARRHSGPYPADAPHTSAWRASAAGPIAQDPTRDSGEQARRLSCPYPASREQQRGRRTAPCAAPGRTRHRRCDRAGSPRPGS